jgi:biotin operon repressor
MDKKISLRARAALMFYVNSDMTISADRLAEEVAEGRKAIQAAMRELREVGYVITRKERFGNKVVTVSYVTKEGFLAAHSWGVKVPLWRSETDLLLHMNAWNVISKIDNHSNNNHYKPTGAQAPSVEEPVGYNFFKGGSSDDAELVREKDRAAKERRKQYDEDKARVHQQRVEARAATSKLSTNHTLTLFVDRINSTWGLAPWRISGSRFLIALNTARRKYATDGVIEEEMINIFFTQLKITKQTDSNLLWMLFIKNFSALASQAKLRIQTPDKLEVAQQQSDESWKGL